MGGSMNICETLIYLAQKYRNATQNEALRIKLAANIITKRINKNLKFNLKESTDTEPVFTFNHKGVDHTFRIKGDNIAIDNGSKVEIISELISDIYIKLITERVNK